MTQKQLRPYQEEAISRIRGGIQQGQTRGIVHFFTGGGKSVTAIETNKRWYDPQKCRSIMIAPARSLIFQMANNYKDQWGELRAGVALNNTVVPGLGIVMERYNQTNARIIVGSAQTLVDKNIEDYDPIQRSDFNVDKYGNITKNPNSKRRVLVSERFDDILAQGGLPQLLQLDEAHHAVADGTLGMVIRLQQIQAEMQVAPIHVVGYTATPTRNDGKGLFNLFQTIYISRSYKWAQENGYLVPFSDPVRVVVDDGDRTVRLKNTINWLDIVVDVAKERCSDRHIMGFVGRMGDMHGVEASIAITKAFNDAGISAAHTDGGKCIDTDGRTRPLSARGDIYNRFMKGEIRALWSFGVGLEGLDLPIADTLFWLKDTENSLMITQAVGRIARLHPDKKDAQIFEFSNKGIHLSPVGTLLGYKVDPFTEQYVEEENPEEDDEILDGINIKDLTKPGEVWGENKVYNVTEIISKSSSDWHRDENTDFMTLSVSPKTIFAISPPNYTKGDLYTRAAGNIEVLMMSQQNLRDSAFNPYDSEINLADYERFKTLKQMNDEQLMQLEELLLWAKRVTTNFCLWRVDETKNGWKIANNSFIMFNPSLDMLVLDSVEYSYMHVQDQTDMFSDKKKSWKSRDKATAKQRYMLSELGYKQHNDERLKKGEASRWIAHLTIIPVLTRYFTAIENFLQRSGVK